MVKLCIDYPIIPAFSSEKHLRKSMGNIVKKIVKKQTEESSWEKPKFGGGENEWLWKIL